MQKYIIKRNGSHDIFKKEKIINAIMKAVEEVYKGKYYDKFLKFSEAIANEIAEILKNVDSFPGISINQKIL